MVSARFTHRPALTCFLSCAAGITAARIFGIPSHIEILIASSLVLAFAIVSYFLRSKFKVTSQVVGIFALLSLGFLLLSSQEYLFENSVINRVAAVHPGDAIVSGRIISNPEFTSSSISFFLETDSLLVDSLVFQTPEKISVTVSSIEKAGPQFTPNFGQKVKLYGELEQVEKPRNPYEYSSDTKLKEKESIRAKMYLHSLFDLYITDTDSRLTILEKSSYFFKDIYERSKEAIANSISDSLTRGFVSAVVLGDKTELSPETLDDFQRAGLTHLLVVSGFNVSIVAMLVYYLLRLAGLPFRKLRITLSMFAVLFYCLVVGLEPSVVRALIVIEFIFISRLLERKPDIGNLTAAAALVTIIFHPYDLFDIGFQLSYGAVFSLVFFYPSFERLFISKKIPGAKTFLLRTAHRSLQSFFGSLSVFLGLLPVFLYHFHQVSIVGLAINILGIPLAAIVTIFGFLLLPISLLSNWLASLYGEALFWMTKVIASIAHFSGKFTWSVIELPRPQTVLIVFYIAAAFYIIHARMRANAFGRLILVCSLMLILFFARIPFAYSLIRAPETTSLLFFDVGQGDAMLLTASNGKSFLVDFGGITQGYSPIADKAIAPFFKAEGIVELGGGFITHMHMDHYGGAVSMMQNAKCQALYTSGERTSGYAAYRLDSISQALHIPVMRVHQGDRIDVEDVHIFVLNPETCTDEVTLALSSEGMNHHSLALKVVYKNSSALLLGDIEATDEERLVKQYGSFLRSDIVKVAHHGSRTSSDLSLVKTARPKYAVISVGKHNTFGHPNPSVVKRWIKSGATVLRTDKEGALLFQSDGNIFRKIDWN